MNEAIEFVIYVNGNMVGKWRSKEAADIQYAAYTDGNPAMKERIHRDTQTAMPEPLVPRLCHWHVFKKGDEWQALTDNGSYYESDRKQYPCRFNQQRAVKGYPPHEPFVACLAYTAKEAIELAKANWMPDVMPMK